MYKFYTFIIVIISIGCGKKENTFPCQIEPLQIEVSTDTGCSSGGVKVYVVNRDVSLRISALRKFGTNQIKNLPSGKHKLSIEILGGCTIDTLIEIPYIVYGPLFTDVKRIMNQHCVQCHGGLNPHAGLDFSITCQITLNSERIRQRSILGTSSPMPPTGLINESERNAITRWINSGSGLKK